MNCFYKADNSCLEFTNEEIMQYLVKPLMNIESLKIKVAYETYDHECLVKMPCFLKESSNRNEIIEYNNSMRENIIREKIDYINLDAENDGFSVVFRGHMIGIFYLNEEFMFFDDEWRKIQTSSETYKNVVYEGELRNLTHKEILELIYRFIMILNGSKKIAIKEKMVKERGIQYPLCHYEVELIKDVADAKQIKIENIMFLIKSGS